MINLEYPDLLTLIDKHLATTRSESASFLIWYLENYYRLDALEATDCVCDQKGDMGVDGIYVNDSDQTVTVFQAKISQSNNSTIGDKTLREFIGTLSQFANQSAISNLISSAGNAQVASLARRYNLADKVTNYEVKGEFLTNVELDDNGRKLIKDNGRIFFVGKSRLITTYISPERDIPSRGPADFDISGIKISEYIVDKNISAIIDPIKAKELTKLDGILDQSIFAHNVRGPLGRTNVNKDIVNTIKDVSSHKMFPLFHNGITMIAEKLELIDPNIKAENFFVVNGCQSLTSLYEHKDMLSDDLRILVKFIKMDPKSDWARKITQFSNNQNGVKARDFKANNMIQIRLKNEFEKYYLNEYGYEIKRGEILSQGTIIKNEEAGLALMAFDMKEPWGTHRKYEIFEDKYAAIFARPEVTADRIILCYCILENISKSLSNISNTAFAKYVLTRYMILYFVREVLESDTVGLQVLNKPQNFVRRKEDLQYFSTCIGKIVADIIIDLNVEVVEYGDDFDYRDKLRDSKWVKELQKSIISTYQKLVARKSILSFSEEWNNRASA